MPLTRDSELLRRRLRDRESTPAARRARGSGRATAPDARTRLEAWVRHATAANGFGG